MSNGQATIQRGVEWRDMSHWEPKCHHSIMVDSDGFRLLMVCEVLTAAYGRAMPITLIGNPCLMFMLIVIFLKPNRAENV